MKKLVIIALALVAGASLHTAQAETADGATKAPQKKAVAAKAGDDKGALASVADSVSYAAGMSMTNGLIPFIRQNMDVDTAFMADFIRGFEETVSKKDIEALKAYAAGIQIANMLNSRMLPGIKKDFDGTQLNISDFWPRSRKTTAAGPTQLPKTSSSAVSTRPKQPRTRNSTVPTAALVNSFWPRMPRNPV